MKILDSIFKINDTFSEDEWILKHKITAILYLSLFGGIGVMIFSVYRSLQGNLTVGIIQFTFGLFLLLGFFMLKRDKKYYKPYSIFIFILFFFYIHIIFFYVPQNSLNILWIISAPVLIFFFLDKEVGTLFLVMLLGFIAYLIYVEYPYTVPEYITLFFVLTTTSLVMYSYERLKDLERDRLIEYNRRLERDILKHTKELKELNATLEERIKKEVAKQTEQEQMLLRQSRMASMGQMIDAIAHQWRQPLMNINAILMILDRELEGKNNRKLMQEKVMEIFSITAHMSRTIDDFRNLLKSDRDRQKFILCDVVEDVLKLIKSNLKGIEINKNFDNSVQAEVCRSELSQVLIIILSNASDIFKIRDIKSRKIDITIKEINEKSIISIGDNAGGIAKELIDKIFDPYFTTKKQTGGTGLGLYVAKIIIEHNMNGKILVRNSNGGTKFTIVIPNSRSI